MAHRVSIKDVASRAGVSWKTVSNVVHERPVVKDATRRRVLDAIADLGYVPNHAARDLRGGPTRTVSLVVPQLQNPYFARLAEMMQAAARERDHSVSVEVSLGSVEVERGHVLGRVPRPVDAVIISPEALTPADLLGRTSGPRVVLLGERIPSAENVVHVAIDNVSSAADVVRHLVGRGRSRLLFLGAERTPPSTGADRFTGYRAALRYAGVEVDPQLLRTIGSWSRESGRAAVREALDAGIAFDAVIAANDLIAIGALDMLRERHVAVPEQVAVVGWDDLPEAQYTVPPLTSVAPDMDALVTAALDAAIGDGTGHGAGIRAGDAGTDAADPAVAGAAADADAAADAAEVVVSHTLRVRGSTGA